MLNLRNVRSPSTLSVWLRPEPGPAPLRAGVVQLEFGVQPGEYTMLQGGQLVTARLRAARQGHDLEALLGSGRARLATIDQISSDQTAIQLTIRLFNGPVVELGDIDVGIDDLAYRAAGKLLGIEKVAPSAVALLLTELCALKLGSMSHECFFLLTTGAAAVSDFEPATDGRGSAASSPGTVTPLRERAFSLHGDGIRIAVASRRVGPDELKYLATRLTGTLGGAADGAVRLARGRLTFSDYTLTGPVRELAAGTMARLMDDENGGYLKKWDEYGDIEGELLLARARKVGMLRWTGAEQIRQGVSRVKLFFAEPLPNVLAAGDALEITSTSPVYLERPEMTWAQYLALLDSEADARREDPDQRKPQEDQEGATPELLELSERSLVLKLDAPPKTADLFLILSLNGDRTQIERRREARRRVVEARSANPLLGLIIEENGEPPPPLRRSEIKPLSAFVKTKVFPKNPPTRKQEEAIAIALNTPDIALIQGPPGTGKTTVIAAIIERLNELSDKGRSIQGEVLISAFQHDAIENIMARLKVNSLPLPKFGQRSGTSALGDRNAEQTRRWCVELVAKVREKNPGLKVSEKLLEARTRCYEYILAPSLDNAIATVQAFLDVPAGNLPLEVAHQARSLKGRLELDRDGPRVQQDAQLLRAVWGLRTSTEGFQDDGPPLAHRLLELCRADLSLRETQLLLRAAGWSSAEPPPFLDELKELKRDLLERYRPQAIFRLDKPRQDVLAFVGEAARCLEAPGGASRRDRILAEFVQEMESNPTAAQRAVEDYGFVFAATCQQSQGKAITKRKAKAAAELGAADYDTVIIDEAARSSPRDLLIPMTQARRRIILVGDHRQLPHMINEEIAKTLEAREDEGNESAASREESYIRRSMFQYLLSRLKQLQARDGIPRWVTLDKQFRMHPLLGKFVSDHFYRVHDEQEAFDSPLGPDGFVHDLPGIPAVPALWIDMPSSQGDEVRSGTSWQRKCEARLIAKWLHRWIDSPAGRRLTFGVISFYKPQVDEVFEALSQHGYTHRDADEAWKVAEAYAEKPKEKASLAEERLRIGTVDGFQGMEFDVVFLSMVRSRERVPGSPVDLVELARLERSVYGHLTSANRLCVSMSRQRRLLVVVGDKAMVEHELARRAVPGLVGFLELCKAHGAVLGAGE